MTYAITRAADADAAYMPIWAPLLQFNMETVGDAKGEPFALVISEPGSSETAGGLWALSLWGSFYIGLVVTPKDARGQGLGAELMRQAEAEARAFYERLGFEVFGQIDGPPPMFPRVFMQKLLETE